jgi:hypothetical protein
MPAHERALFVMFDQKIDPQAVLAKLKVTVSGKPWGMRMVDTAELARLADSKRDDEKQLASLVEAARKNEQDGRWLAFRGTQDFPADAAVTVTIPAGTPSAEGPNTTPAAQTLAFRTYPPLAIRRAECGYSGNCPPGTPFVIELNNPLDVDRFDESWISVSPEIPGMKIVQNHNVVVVQGMTKADHEGPVVSGAVSTSSARRSAPHRRGRGASVMRGPRSTARRAWWCSIPRRSGRRSTSSARITSS